MTICAAIGKIKRKADVKAVVVRLIGCMADEKESVSVRYRAYRALKSVTGIDPESAESDHSAKKFAAAAPMSERSAAVKAWKAWWRERASGK